MTGPLLALLIGMAALVVIYARGRAGTRRQRAAIFADALGLFDSYRVVQDGLHFPVLTGIYLGRQVRIEPVIDNFAWRKLPLLWLKVTLLEPHSQPGVLDFLMRPLGTEFYSPIHDLDLRLPVPADWPEDGMLAGEGDGAYALVDRVSPHMRLFDDPRMKELVVTPRGVRLVYLAAQASRAQYVVFREIRFDGPILDAETLRRLLDATFAIGDSLAGASPLSRAA